MRLRERYNVHHSTGTAVRALEVQLYSKWNVCLYQLGYIETEMSRAIPCVDRTDVVVEV